MSSKKKNVRLLVYHHHHISVMELGHLLTRSCLTYLEVSSKVCHDSFCQSWNSVSLPWVIYYEAFYLHVVSSYTILKPNNFSGMDMSREWKRGDCLKEVMKWRPPGRRKRGRPKLSWAEGIRGLMGEKGLMEEDWNDRSNWRKKII